MVESGNSFTPEQHDFELPPADSGELDQTQTQEQAPVVETVGKLQEQAKQPPKLLPADQPSPSPAADQAHTGAKPAAPVTQDNQILQALPAKDADLIEKEWVVRAKAVIAKTADDPHKQKHEVSKMKAAYIQKRFNKAVKTDEAAA